MKTASALVLAFLVVASGARAQTCNATDTPNTCWQKFNPAPATVVAQSATSAQHTVTVANTGVSSLASPSSSAVKDFLSLLSASIESSTLSSDGQALTLDYNPPFEILGAPNALKLQAVFIKPMLNPQFTSNLANNAAALQSAEDSLTNTDDVSISGTVQPTSETFGRSIVPHRPMFESMLIATMPNDLVAKNNALVAAITAGGITSENQAFSSVPAATQAATIAAFEAAAKQQASLNTQIKSFTDVFAQLLNNQPQLYVSAVYDARKNIVGPNEWTGKATYEMGAKNLNGFRRRYGSTCTEATLADTATAAKCAGLLATYAGPAQALADDRLVFSLEYHRTNRRWINEPSLGFSFGYPRSHSLVYDLTYGRTVMGPVTGANNGRIDLTVKYEDVSGSSDPTQDVSSQASASLTYTQKINDSISLPVSLVWANQASQLTNVDKKLNAHFGIVYKLPSK